MARSLIRTSLLAAWTAVFAAISPAGEPPTPVSLRTERRPGAVDRVEVILEAAGDLLLSPEWKKAEKLKMSAAGTLHYDEMSLDVSQQAGRALRSIRYYDKAEAVLTVGEDQSQPRLRDQRRLIGAEIDGAAVTLFSPLGTLTADELELIDVLGNSLALDMLLPDHRVAVGGTWKHSDKAMSALCDLDSVSRNDVQSTLASLDDAMARVEMSGALAGTSRGLATSIELKAKYRFDRRVGRITWLGMLVKQSRAAGAVVPGLNAVARLQVTVEPIQESKHLTEAALQDVSPIPTEPLKLVSYESPDGTWRVDHDRRWEVTTQRGNTATLRMADRGLSLAQCKISGLSRSGEAGAPPSLADFQADIQRALGKQFGQFLQASQSTNPADYRVYRVVVQGKVSDVPVQWMYYMLGDKLGRRLVLVFNLRADMLDRFANADQQLVNALRFVDHQVAAKRN